MDEIITLDVGGTLFKTTKSTLLNAEYFQNMFHFESNKKRSIKIKFEIDIFNKIHINFFENDNNNYIFIDRDPEIFQYVLRLLRGNTCSFPEEYFDELQYYGIEFANVSINNSSNIDKSPYKVLNIDFEKYNYFRVFNTFTNGSPNNKIVIPIGNEKNVLLKSLKLGCFNVNNSSSPIRIDMFLSKINHIELWYEHVAIITLPFEVLLYNSRYKHELQSIPIIFGNWNSNINIFVPDMSKFKIIITFRHELTNHDMIKVFTEIIMIDKIPNHTFSTLTKFFNTKVFPQYQFWNDWQSQRFIPLKIDLETKIYKILLCNVETLMYKSYNSSIVLRLNNKEYLKDNQQSRHPLICYMNNNHCIIIDLGSYPIIISKDDLLEIFLNTPNIPQRIVVVHETVLRSTNNSITIN